MIKRKLKFYAILGFIIVILIGGLSLFFFLSLSGYQQYKLVKEADRVLQKNIANEGAELVDYSKRYENIIPTTEEGTLDYVRGNGLNLLLLNNISNKSYMQEYLTIIQEASNGDFIPESLMSSGKIVAQVPYELYLSMAVNEAGYFSGSDYIPRTMLTYSKSDKKVIWNEEYRGYPASAMTLHQVNSSMTGLNLNSHYLGSGTYKNVFQINKNYFSDDYFLSSATGYNMSANRKLPDMYFLPDSFNYITTNYNQMIRDYGVPLDNETGRAMYAIYHNGGPGQMYYYSTFGVVTQSRLDGAPKKSEDYLSLIEEFVQMYKNFGSLHDSYDIHKSAEKGYVKSFWMFYDNGYYFDKVLATKMRSNLSTLANVYKVMYGKEITTEQVNEIIVSRTKEPWEVGYVDYNQYEKTYGSISDSSTYNKGTYFKFLDRTSVFYKHKVDGKATRIFKRINQEVAGYVWDALFAGKYLYADFLSLAGVNVDPTNPDDYLEKIQNEYIPSFTSFEGILDSIGAKPANDTVYKALEAGYNASGNWYFYGGAGKMVSEANWDYFQQQAITYASMAPLDTILKLYETKDGTSPKIEYNRRNENLVNYGKLAFDCSALIVYSYNKAVVDTSAKPMPGTSSTGFYNDTTYTYKKAIADRVTGDMFVREGHIYFYLSDSKKGQEMGTSISKAENNWTYRPRAIWSLEAAESGTKVGIRLRGLSSKNYILKRFYKFD